VSDEYLFSTKAELVACPSSSSVKLSNMSVFVIA